MQIIDDEGKVFGLVNVIDALVVLFVIGMVVVGLALVDPFSVLAGGQDESLSETRYVTLYMGEHPVTAADRLSEGDVMEVSESERTLTITDVHVGPASNDTVSVTVRAEIEGTLNDGDFEFDGEPIRWGEHLTVTTAGYRLNGTVVTVASEGETLDVEATDVVVRATVSADVASRIEPGAAYTIAGQEVATLETVEIYSTGNSTEKRVVAGLTLYTRSDGPEPIFGDTTVRRNATVGFETDTFGFSGTVLERGTLDPPGELTTAEAVVKLENVSPELADAVQVGMEDRAGGTTTARITDKRTEPATIVTETEAGELQVQEHPHDENVYLTVEVRLYDTPLCLQFGTECFRIGDEIAMDFRTVAVEGTVIELEVDGR